MKIPFAPVNRAARMAIRHNSNAFYGVVSVSVIITALCNILLSLMGVSGVPTTPTSDTNLLITLFTSLFIMLVSAPISMGLFAVCSGALTQKPVSIGTGLSFYSDPQKLKTSVFGMLYYFLLAFCRAFLFMLPVAFLVMVNEYAYLIGTFIAVLLAGGYILSRMPAMFILARDPSRPILQAFNRAKQIMRPYVWNFYLLALSYGVFAVAITFGLSYLSLIPGFGMIAQLASNILTAVILMYMYTALTEYFLQVEKLANSADTNL